MARSRSVLTVPFLALLVTAFLLTTVVLMATAPAAAGPVARDQEDPEDKEFAGERKPVSTEAGEEAPEPAEMILTSPAFADGERIPVQFTCEGEDRSPALSWTGVPELTRSFVLICEDPDAPVGTWDHWVLFNLPAELRSLPEEFGREVKLPPETAEGRNSWGRTGYGGPCPPPGKPHRYIFRLFALNVPLPLESGATKEEILEALKLRVLAEAELVGLYSRNH